MTIIFQHFQVMKLSQEKNFDKQIICCDKISGNQTPEVIDFSQQSSHKHSTNIKFPLKQQIDSAPLYDATVNNYLFTKLQAKYKIYTC